MDKESAALWGAVARRIGLAQVVIVPPQSDHEEWLVSYDPGRNLIAYFDPPANPADERILTEYAINQKLLIKQFPPELSDGHITELWRDSHTCVGDGEHPDCRVTALGRAIHGLPV